MRWLLVMVLMCSLHAKGGTDTSHMPGIYYEKVDELVVIQTYWRVAVQLNTTNINMTLSKMKYLEDKKYKNQFLDPLPDKDNFIADIIKTQVEQSRKLYEKINNLKSHFGRVRNINRPKRDLSAILKMVPLLGSAAKTLYDIVKPNDSAYVSQAMSQISPMSEAIVKLIPEKQMHVTEAIGISMETFQHIASSFQRVSKYLNWCNDVSYQYSRENRLLSGAIVHFQQQQAEIQLILGQLTKEEKILKQIRQGLLPYDILTEHQLERVLDDIETVHQDLTVPIPQQHWRLEEIAKISKIDAFLNGENVIITIDIPLVRKQRFNVYRMHSVPTIQKIDNIDYVANIQPRTSHLILSQDHNLYFLSNENYLNTCIRRHYGLIGDVPKIQESARAEDCEIKLITQPAAVKHEHCNIALSGDLRQEWTYLSSEGAWLYTRPMEEHAKMICAGMIDTQINLGLTGKITVDPFCTMKSGEYIITNKLQQTQTDSTGRTPLWTLNTTRIIADILTEREHQRAKELIESMQASRETVALARLLQMSREPQTENTQYFLIYTLISLNVLLLSITSILIYLTYNKRNNPPPTMRTRSIMKLSKIKRVHKSTSTIPLESAIDIDEEHTAGYIENDTEEHTCVSTTPSISYKPPTQNPDTDC